MCPAVNPGLVTAVSTAWRVEHGVGAWSMQAIPIASAILPPADSPTPCVQPKLARHIPSGHLPRMTRLSPRPPAQPRTA
ncbi:hypothetical protein IMZ48_31815 [Candidatus Bathyarchaeota archaeon]|nr:hypothetical protein [Candidatus Bathyarchaeota archaeon]